MDQTWIHPESYDVVKKIIKEAECDVTNLGTESFIEKIEKYARQGNATLAKKFATEQSTVDVIIKGLTVKKNFDVRLKGNKPLFPKNLKGIEDLQMGDEFEG